MLLFVWDREFEIAEFKIANGYDWEKQGKSKGNGFEFKIAGFNCTIFTPNSIVCQAGPNLHTLKTQQRK